MEFCVAGDLSLASKLANLLADLREARPLVQCVTNDVSLDFVANALLALGASPTMASAPEEADDVARHAQAIVCNMGTPSRTRAESLTAAAAAARTHGKPWTFDPVGVDVSAFRKDLAARLMQQSPTAIRANASEVLGLARIIGVSSAKATPRGVEATDGARTAEHAAIAIARERVCIVATTGDVDLVTDGRRLAHVAGGAPMMTRVTAMGCALSALVSAFLAVGDDAFLAALAATAVFAVAGERAAAALGSQDGPATFRVRFLDQLYALDADAIAPARVTLSHA